MTLGLLALVSWLVAAGLGAVLLVLWVSRRARGAQRTSSRPPPYIPRSLIVSHVLLAVAGLVAWIGALLFEDGLGWVALGSLVLVALLGAGMFVRWLGSRRAGRAARAVAGAPAESRLPALVVLCHGLMGLATFVLVVLSYFHPGPL